jgi:tRNA-Thr(GGU) m(6)t(6)A37 methyltransferase TsaA
MPTKDQNPHSTEYYLRPVGLVIRNEDKTFIEILPSFRAALKELDHFSHAQIIWWFSHYDDAQSRKMTQFDQMPFDAPVLGVFACRSPIRPNPLGLTTVKILDIDHKNGIIYIAKIDADDGTPIIDIKAYLPSCDRVRQVKVAEWAANWPEWIPEDGLGLE